MRPMAETYRTQNTSQPSSARPILLLLVISGMMVLPGCAVWGLAQRTLHTELAQYPRVTDGYMSRQTYRQWAREAWEREVGTHGLLAEDEHYRQGFIDGFVDFVSAGGNGEPPPIPPRRFWKITYRTPAGDQVISQWSQGFRDRKSVV